MRRSVAVTLSRRRSYGWLVASLALLVVTTSNGMISSGLTVFDESLLDELGCTVGQLKARDAITFVCGSLLVFVAGWLIDRHGFKPLLLTGMVMLAAGYFLYGRAETLMHLYLLHLLLAAVIASAGNTVSIVTAATWMPKRRGLAVGMAIAGSSIGAMIMPPLSSALNLRFGWRDAMRIESVIPLAIFVVLLVALRNRPRSSDRIEDAAGAATGASEGLPFGTVIRSARFYRVIIAGALAYYAVLSFFSHLFLFMRSLGFDPTHASLGLSTFALSGLAGKLGCGWLSAHTDPYRLVRVQMVTMLTGLLGATLAPRGTIWLSLVIAGLGWGGLHTLFNYILIDLFGLRDAGRVNGSLSVGGGLGGGLGILLTGLAHDAFGGYTAAFTILCAVMSIGVILTLRLRPPRPDPEI